MIKCPAKYGEGERGGEYRAPKIWKTQKCRKKKCRKKNAMKNNFLKTIDLRNDEIGGACGRSAANCNKFLVFVSSARCAIASLAQLVRACGC